MLGYVPSYAPLDILTKKENVMSEQKQSDPVREMFEKEIKNKDGQLKGIRAELAYHQEQANDRKGRVERIEGERRALIDAMQKVCNVVNKYPESSPVLLSEAFRKAADIEANTPVAVGFNAKGLLDEIKRQGGFIHLPKNDPEVVKDVVVGPIVDMAEVNHRMAFFGGVSVNNPARQPQKDFVVRFKCGCCVRWDFQDPLNPINPLQTAKLIKCDMANGCYYDEGQVNGYWEQRENTKDGGISLSAEGGSVLHSAKWESPK